jgi:Tfp pilus assembly protein PilV
LQNASDPIAHTATSATIRVSLDAELSDFTEERVLQLKRDIAKVSGSPIESIQVQLQPGSVIAVVTMPRLAVDKMADAVEKGEVGQLGGSLVLAVSGDGELFGRLQISFAWLPTDWAACSVTCGTGIQVREIRCESNSGQLAVDSGQCRGGKPGMSKECTVGLACEVYMWKPSAFGPCSATCGAGNAHRLVECYDARNFLVPNDRCPQPPPSTTRPCEQACASSTILPTGAIVSRAITAIEPLPDVNDGSSTDSSSSILLYILIVVGILVALLLGLVVYCLMKNNKEAAKRTQAEQQLQIQMSSMRLQQAVASPIDSPGSLRDPALQISPYATAGNHSSACEQALPASGDLETNEASLAEVAVSVETATALPVAVAVQLDL